MENMAISYADPGIDNDIDLNGAFVTAVNYNAYNVSKTIVDAAQETSQDQDSLDLIKTELTPEQIVAVLLHRGELDQAVQYLSNAYIDNDGLELKELIEDTIAELKDRHEPYMAAALERTLGTEPKTPSLDNGTSAPTPIFSPSIAA